MAIENVKAFYEALEKDADLQAKINAADAAYNGDADDQIAAAEAIIIPVAKAAGFDFTAEELMEYDNTASQAEDFEFTEDELESVAGGFAGCAIIGFGKAKMSIKNGSFCACNIIGIGAGFGGKESEWNS